MAPSSRLASALTAAALVTLVACEARPGVGEAGPPVAPPAVELLAPPWSSPELREIVDLQVLRDGGALRERLGAEDPDVRARAAFALASVQDAGAARQLSALLDDPDPGVRREAAFALGQIELPDGGQALADALATEEDSGVRRRLVEALGKRGGPAAGAALVAARAAGAGEEADRALALARLAHRQVSVEGLFDELVRLLSHPDPAVRTAAAYHFARSPEPETWAGHAEGLRDALDGYALDEPAAMHLLVGLGLLRDRTDRDRFVRWMAEATDWRIRVNAARATGTTTMLETEGIRDALFERVESDPSIHVAQAAAQTLTMGFLVPERVVDRMARIVEDGSRARWRAHLPFLEQMMLDDRHDVILRWAGRMRGEHSFALIRALGILGRPTGGDEVTRFVDEMLDHRDPAVRAAALAAMANRWAFMPTGETRYQEAADRFREALSEGETPEVVAVNRALTNPAWIPFGSREILTEGLRLLDRDAPVVETVSYLEALAAVGGDDAGSVVEGYLDHPHPRVRAAAAETVRVFTGRSVAEARLPDPERTVDWAALEALGSAPRLHLETNAGEIVARLLPDQAPLTVQVLAELVEDGAFADSPFHRVLPNFVIQGGDFTMKDGSGSPGFTIRSELTRVPFVRGVIGMASSGKDTEGSQFFVTHSMQPHLDGAYTAFGWVESGEEALDGVLEGDRIRRARIVRGDGS